MSQPRQQNSGFSNTPISKESIKKHSKNSSNNDAIKEQEALALLKKGNLQKAEEIYKELISNGTRNHVVYGNLATIYLKWNRYVESISLLQEAIEINPKYPDARVNMGIALQAKGDLNAAIASYNSALQLKPDHPKIHLNVGIALQAQGDLKAAIASYKTALKLDPDYPQAHNNLGLALKAQGNPTAAIASYNTALKLNPDYPQAHWNFSLIMLLCGDYKNGWEKYEWRLKKEQDTVKPHALPKCNQWSGELAFRQSNRLLLVTEQGLGDTLQFMRFANALKKQGANISLCAQAKLHSLIKASGIDPSPLTPEQANQVTGGDWIPLLSVPRYLAVSPENPIITEPYIKTSDELINKWLTKLEPEQRPIIGINWQGNPKAEINERRGRSIALESFAPLTKNRQISFLSLQKGYGSEQLSRCSFKDRFVSCQDQVNETWDFQETAAIIANCDLVITTDTAVAHLAGGMGKTTWLLLLKVPDWRWGLEGNSTFWYPSMRLFRQREQGNWDEVIERMTKELQKHFEGSSTYSRPIDDRIKLLTKDLQLKPNNSAVHYKLGIALQEKGNLDAAINSYKTAILLEPNNVEASTNLGNALQEKGDLSAAIKIYKATLGIQPDSPVIHNNLGLAFQKQGDLSAAINSYKTAIQIKPNYPIAYYNLALTFQELGNINAAINVYKITVRLKPDYAVAHNNLGNCLKEQGDLTKAAKSYKTAIQLKPDYPEAHQNLSLCLLLAQDYNSGWEEHEWRHRNKGQLLYANPNCKKWNGELLLPNSTLLLVSEQGLGDTLMFMRYALVLKNKGISVSLCAQSKLHSLIQASGIDSSPLTPEQANQVQGGQWIPLLSIPKLLKVSPNNPIITSPYIKTTNQLQDKWKNILSNEQKPIIGVNWQGNPNTEKTGLRGRSLALETFAPLVKNNQISLLSLQKGYGSEQLQTCSFKENFVSCQNQIDETWDFLETAAIIANCNLIITCDTSVAHLAGGMGKATWLLLHKVPDWRWGLEGETTFWYPSIRLFRQTERGNWNKVIEQISEALQEKF